MAPDYAELHALSNFSFLRGASHPEELVETAHALGYAGLALTDECSLAGVVRAHVAAKETGLSLIVGAELALSADAFSQGNKRGANPLVTRVVLLATDRTSYGNLAALITRGRRRSDKGNYRLTRADLDDGCTGCLAILLPPRRAALRASACTNTHDEIATEQARWIAERFSGRAWLAAELLGEADDREHLAHVMALGHRFGLPCVASGDVHMHVRARRALQDTLTAIRLKCTLQEAGYRLFPNGERHLRTRERLARIYPHELLAQTLAVTQRCTFSLDSLRYEYPQELTPAGETPASHLRKLTVQGFEKRFGAPLMADDGPHLCGTTPRAATGAADALQKVRALVEHELRLITELNYEPYFLTVHDIVAFAQSKGILCQGRGSAANSAVCYCLGITEVDPARIEMLFERFISRERNEPPDIDVDFEHQRREEVMQYVYAKYSRERAALAATLITYRPKSAIRDVGKALGLELAQVDRLAKSLAWWDSRDALGERVREAGLDPAAAVIERLIALVGTLIGFPRHLSQHVGGFVISRGPLDRMVPIENAAMPDRTVIQWDKDDLDALGLLKVDCLALGMLSAIRRALDLIGADAGSALPSTTFTPSHYSEGFPPEHMVPSPACGDSRRANALNEERKFTMTDIPAEDPEVYAMIGAADTIGVFQIESRAQMAMLPRLAPRCFYDLVIEVAIVRPGPIQGGMVHPYLRRRQGLEPVSYPSDAVQEVLERTLGVPIFQEQVMQLAIVAAGFSPGEADQLRRSMAAWRRKGGLWRFEERLISGMASRGYQEEFARQIFQQILGFGEYGFPESHAASFALLVYVSAWIKCHHPAAFTCALLNSQPMGFYAPSQLVQDARRHGVEVRPVDVTISLWDCTLEENRGQTAIATPAPDSDHARRNAKIRPGPLLRLGMRMVKGLPEAAAQRIVALRQQRPFASVPDLAQRAALNRHDLACLARAGALESLAGHRRYAAWEVAGIQAMPPLFAQSHIPESPARLPAPTEAQEIVADYNALGLSLRRHPLELLRAHLKRRRMLTAAEIRGLPHGRLVRAAGIVIGRQRPDTASGVIFVTMEDESGCVNVVVWRNLIERQRRELLGARLLGVHGRIEREGSVVHLIAGRLIDLSHLLGAMNPQSRDFH